jgi:hypothetical protein
MGSLASFGQGGSTSTCIYQLLTTYLSCKVRVGYLTDVIGMKYVGRMILSGFYYRRIHLFKVFRDIQPFASYLELPQASI